MKRLGIALVCLAAMVIVSGCSILRDTGANLVRKQHSLFNSGKISEEPASSVQVCLLDPVASADEEAKLTLPEHTGRPPVAEVPVDTHDFGQMSEERDFIHRFSVRNAGSSTLNIKKVVPG